MRPGGPAPLRRYGRVGAIIELRLVKTLFACAYGVWGLFIDDGSLAVCIAVWLAAFPVLLRMGAVGPVWGTLILALGFLAILVESVLRAATKAAGRRS